MRLARWQFLRLGHPSIRLWSPPVYLIFRTPAWLMTASRIRVPRGSALGAQGWRFGRPGVTPERPGLTLGSLRQVAFEASGWAATTLGTGRAAAPLPNWDCQRQTWLVTKEMPGKLETSYPMHLTYEAKAIFPNWDCQGQIWLATKEMPGKSGIICSWNRWLSSQVVFYTWNKNCILQLLFQIMS